MKRPIIYTQEQARTYDALEGWRYTMEGDATATAALLGSTTTVISGGAATATAPASLGVNIAPLTLLTLADVDATAYGDLALDTRQILQSGTIDTATLVTLVTSGLASGQSQWALIQGALDVVDEIPSNDPNNGLLLYWNSSDQTMPYQGPGDNGQTQNTRRRATVMLSVVYGTAAATGSEVPPAASGGAVGLYLVDLTYGQTQIVTILTAGPSVGINVPNNYPYAPFLAGLLNSHHDGNPGQAPKIQLSNGAEVQGVLPLANLPTGSLMVLGSAPDGGAVNAYTMTLSPAPAAYESGMVLQLQDILHTNTGASTIDVNGLGALPIVGPGGTSLQGGELTAGYGAELRINYSKAAAELLSTTGGPLPVAAASQSRQAVQLGQVVSGNGSSNSGTSTAVSTDVIFTPATNAVVLVNLSIGTNTGSATPSITVSGATVVSNGANYTTGLGVASAVLKCTAGTQVTVTGTATNSVSATMSVYLNYIEVASS